MTVWELFTILSIFINLVWVINEESLLSVLLLKHLLQLFTLSFATENMLRGPPSLWAILFPLSAASASARPNPAAPIEPVESIEGPGIAVPLIVIESLVNSLESIAGQFVVLIEIGLVKQFISLPPLEASHLSVIDENLL